jgi:uncharacterized membrane protein
MSDAALRSGVGSLDRPTAIGRNLLQALDNVAAATWFLLLATPVCLFLAFAIPPSQGLDEANHFFRVYQLSGGTVLSEYSNKRVGGMVPDCAVTYLGRLYAVGAQADVFRWRTFFQEPAGCSPSATRFYAFENTAVYSPVSYVPQALGVAIARMVRAPLPLLFYTGRLFGALAYLGLVYLALRVATDGRNVLLVVALMPMALTSASEYSADGMTLALALLLVAGVIRCRQDPRAARWAFALAAGAALGLALTKSSYGVLALALLAVPNGILPSRAASMAVKVGAVAVAGLATLWWAHLVGYVALSAYDYPAGVNPPAQIHYVLAHPLSYAKLVFMTLVGSTTADLTWPGFVSWVGFDRSAHAGSPEPPILLVVFAFIVLVQAYRGALARPSEGAMRAAAALVWPAALIVANAVLIVTALYVTDATVGAAVYWRLHGRYFLPLAAMPAIAVARAPAGGGTAHSSSLVYASSMSALLVFLVAKVVLYFYVY